MDFTIKQSPSEAARVVPPIHAGRAAAAARRGVVNDTVTSGQGQSIQQVTIGDRPSLPPAQKKGDPDYLEVYTAAFTAASLSMNRGILTQINDYADLQNLDLTMSKEILQSSAIAITKENKQFKIAQEITKIQDEEATASTISNDIFIAIGAVFVTVTVVSAIFDAGASLLAVPEEVAAIEGLEGGTELVDIAAPLADDLPEVPMDDLTSILEDPPELNVGDVSFSDLEEGESVGDTEIGSDTAKTVTKDLDETTDEEGKSDTIWNKYGKRSLNFILSMGMSSPTLIEGIMGLKVSSKMGDLESAQREVGTAIANMQKNNMYFQFYQQLLRRASGNITEEVEGMSTLVSTYGDLTKGYQEISFGLAQTVRG